MQMFVCVCDVLIHHLILAAKFFPSGSTLRVVCLCVDPYLCDKDEDKQKDDEKSNKNCNLWHPETQTLMHYNNIA